MGANKNQPHLYALFQKAKMIEHLSVNLNNIHCSDCESTVRSIVSKYFQLCEVELPPLAEEVRSLQPNAAYVFFADDVLDIYYYNRDNIKKSRLHHSIKLIISALKNSGFSTSSWELTKDNTVVLSKESNNSADEMDILEEPKLASFNIWPNYKKRKIRQHHIENCHGCQDKLKEMESSLDSSSDTLETAVVKPTQEYRAVFSVEGMSCATCTQSVSNVIQNVFDEYNMKTATDDPQFSVNLLQHSAIAIVSNKQIVNKIVDAIEEAGFKCQLLEILPVERSINQKVSAIIGGISCASCVNSIVSAVNELPFVLDCGINLVTKSGQFVMENGENDKNLKKLQATIEECGFDFDLVKKEEINFTSGKKSSRQINIGVEGMYCAECPKTIMNYLSSYGEAVVVEDPISLDRPFVNFKYIPNVEKDITLRNFLFDLNHIKPSSNEEGYTFTEDEGAFNCHLVEKVSVDEHLRKMAKKETRKIAIKLGIATVLAIPTFVFGVVGMSLAPKSNPFRVWCDESILNGNASRVMWICFFLSTPVYFFAADTFHLKAIKEVKSLWLHKNLFKTRLFKFGSMNLLMSLGTTVAYICSIVLLGLSAAQAPGGKVAHTTTYFDSVVFLTFFLLIGRLLESLSKNKMADAVSNLGSMKATSSTIVEKVTNKDGSISYTNDKVIDVKYLESGDHIRISTGESPAVDCVMVDGASEFDESALTGESDPVKHIPGHQVFSGTVNVGNTSVIAKVLNVNGDSLLDLIISTVRDGQMKKAPIQQLADKLTGYFVPFIVLCAVVTWIIWISLAYSGRLPDHYLDIDVGGWAVWSLEFAISVFVIACPCGLGLAAPTALFVGSSLAAKHGVLVKGGGSAFQDASKTGVVCFDKTGTLTYGQVKVTDVAFMLHHKESSLLKKVGLQLTKDLEVSSKHPIATAVKDFISNYKSFVPSPNKVPAAETVPGKGLKGTVVTTDEDDPMWKSWHDANVILGNEALLRDYDVKIDREQQQCLDTWKKDRKSIIAVAIQSEQFFKDEKYHLVILLACRDEVRKGTKEVISFLQEKKGIECWMITGDNKLTADAIAARIGIAPDHVISEVLPDEKQAKILELKNSTSKVVAMVGDGINDAPALATADVGIALASGADIAVTSSDFILLNKSHPIVTLCTLLDMAKVVFRRVKFNFCWSLVYNMIGLPIAAGVIYPYKNLRLPPVWASAAMALSSISVVTSSLLLRFYKPKIKEDYIEVIKGQGTEVEGDKDIVNEIEF